jgi:catechol 2,3-dioxygenase-like lactoylglutathione lyase family enzyme
MTSINQVTLEVPSPDIDAARDFYSSAFGAVPQIRLAPANAESYGFRGFTLSLIVSQPASVDALTDAALAGGAAILKPAKRQFWGGYSGVVQAPDGTICKLATSAKKNTAPHDRHIDSVTLILGVADIKQSKQYYIDQGLTVAKSFGSKYVEFAAAGDAIMLALYKRAGLAKDAGVAVDGGGSHQIIIGADAGAFVDPDGFAWESVSAAADVRVNDHEDARGRD